MQVEEECQFIPPFHGSLYRALRILVTHRLAQVPEKISLAILHTAIRKLSSTRGSKKEKKELDLEEVHRTS